MTMNASGRTVEMISRAGWLGLLVVILTACAGPLPSAQEPVNGEAAPARPKSLTIGITSSVPAMSLAVATGTPTGGWMALMELHTDGLVTSDANSRSPVGRLAEGVPSSAYRTVKQALADPQIAHRGALAEVEDGGGTFKVLNLPFRMSGAKVSAARKMATCPRCASFGRGDATRVRV